MKHLFQILFVLILCGCSDDSPPVAANNQMDFGSDSGADLPEVDMPQTGPYEYDSVPIEGIEYEDILGNTRAVPALARVPKGVQGQLPLVLLSHGGAQGKDNPSKSLTGWGEFLTSQGYLTIAVAHSGRERTSYDALCDALDVQVAERFFCSIKIHWDRPNDIKAVLDHLESPSNDSEWINQADLSRIALVGHSAGAGAALMVAGATRNFKCAQPIGQAQGSLIPCAEEDMVDMRDPRIKVAVGLSPQGINDEGFTRDSFLEVEIPMMIISGAADGDPGVPENRMTSFDYMAEGEHRAVFLDDVGAVHELFEGDLDRCATIRDEARCEIMRGWIFWAVDRFLAGHLKGDSLEELNPTTLETISEGIATLTLRESAPRPIDMAKSETCPVDPSALRQATPEGSALKRMTIRAAQAVCNDGSPAIAYVRRAEDMANANRWVIYLQGGGGCDGKDACAERWCGEQGIYDAGKMSSRWARSSIDGRGIFNRIAPNDLGAGNQVYVYYCSSDSWLGQSSRVQLEDGDYLLNARGHHIVEGLLQQLHEGGISDDGSVTLPRLNNADLIVWSGSSAGSVGASSHLDYVASLYPDIRVVGAFDAGFGPNIEAFGTPIKDAALSHLQASYQRFDLPINAFSDTSCLTSGAEAYRCFDANFLKEVGHVTTPFFQRLDLRDTTASRGLIELGTTQLEWTTQAHVSMINLGISGAGVYGPNCGQHVALTNNYWYGQAQVGELDSQESFASALSMWLANQEVRIVDSIDGELSTCGALTDERE